MGIKAYAFMAMLVFASSANACINAVGTDHTGRTFMPDWYTGKGMTDPIFQQTARNNWLAGADRTIRDARTEPDFGHLTDLGVLLIYQGQYALAVRHFLFVERRFPGRLGTALELAGHDDVALRWIRIGIRRNQAEHYGSEWLHARILQAKIALAADPAYLTGRSVAGVWFEPKLVPSLPDRTPAGNNGKPVEPWKLNQALAYQLYERTQFVRPKDPIVANLLLDWATLNLAGGPIENADALYDAAVAYGAPRDALVRSRQDYIKRTLAQAPKGKTPTSDDRCAICQPRPLPSPPQ
ncbi:hypothetical protein MNR01_01850 [Lysobacter sp. S4-A87]|uniref:hypothetical protein n=1 Tax=Lysobacter sp. S4-A87 TaxID=2925843 RepID=UPI001F530FC1|nr:hypothetical protein [Lysobacter sp. S4-A87]UNK49806.1 hypothetical protein MNR01_01850 [Lysobacter sp. S4-A87]